MENILLKFLLIDDDIDDRDLFCEAIHEIDPEIICYAAAGGRKALDMLDNHEIKPDIIFLDVNMPMMNGWQCLSILKHQDANKHIPVIIYSTTSHPEDIEAAHNAGAMAFFTKPANFRELIKSLEAVVDYLKCDSSKSPTLSSPEFASPSK